ncbi:MAG: hypothetical protein [Bacteriophage sp.]|nr:MAG: hypothetical protein [Bacteriophage sp.]
MQKIINDGKVDTALFTDKDLILFGEAHGNKRDEDLVDRIIRDWKPDYVLVEALGDLKLMNNALKQQAFRKPSRDLSYEDFTNKHWIAKALNHDIPFIGMEYTASDTSWLSLVDSFKLREDHFVNVIECYRDKGKILAICGDTHLRTVACSELGGISPLYTRFGNSAKTSIIRTLHGEIE